ncbi:hypothetical protein GCM10022383_26100 [Microbacterium soli]|uniref:Uncharacterized protein n=1 Tax=Microbacterium soli TaxID=446075 RepID=A0ABP7NH77_9MICO
MFVRATVRAAMVRSCRIGSRRRNWNGIHPASTARERTVRPIVGNELHPQMDPRETTRSTPAMMTESAVAPTKSKLPPDLTLGSRTTTATATISSSVTASMSQKTQRHPTAS